MENWCCRRCQFCNVCGHQNHLLRCDRCQSTYHPECLGPSYPTRPSKKNIWVCTKCVKCKSCGATTPGVGTNATWTYDFSLCYDCGRLMDKGNFCPICHKCYTDDDWESKMIQCVSCESWVHAKCEELSDEMYQLLSYLPEDVHYTCRICTTERPAPWEQLLRAEFVASLKTVLYNLFGMKCAQHLMNIDEKRERRSNEKRKSSPKGRGSPGKSTTPVSMAMETIPRLQVLNDPESEPAVLRGEVTPSCSQIDTSVSVSRNSGEMLPREQLCTNVGGEICDSAVTIEKEFEENKVSMETETLGVNKVATDTERNIFKLIDECLMGDKMAASLCSDPQIGEGEQLRSSGKPGSDSVSMETESCEKSDGRESENLGTNPEEMQVDSSLQDDDQELLSYLRSCGESPEKETVSVLDSEKSQTEQAPENVQTCAIIGGEETENGTKTLKDIEQKGKDSEKERMIEASKGTSSVEKLLEVPVRLAETPPLFANTPDSGLSLVVQVDSAEKLQDSLKSSDFESLTDGKNTSMEAVNNQTPEKSVAEVVMMESPESDCSSGKKKKCNRQFPRDFESIKDKLDEDKYHSVEEFSEDMVHIIQTALSDPGEQTHMRKKFNNSVRSVFVKQMEKCFPWFNINTCKLWEHNKNLPESMLPDAVLPPSDDHTYAQWLEREDPPLSPQPSPFKKLQIGSLKRTVPMSSLDGDSETSSVVAMSDYGGDDLRQCLLCSAFGDDIPDEAGRLLYINHDDWVHVNCALWSAEVFEESDATLQNVHIAVGRGRQMKCDYCGKSGATVGCCNRGCSANFHFKCARADRCVFQEDKKVYCKLHTAQVDGEIVEDGNFHVLRRVCIDTQGRYNKKTWNKGVHPSVLNILIGSCTIESLGHLGPLSDVKGCLLPIDFMCTRVYWSTQDARRRCVYTCRIVEVRPNPASPELKISDMRIVHDESHPDFVPMDHLNMDAKSLLHMLSPNSNSDVMIVSETSRTVAPQLSIMPMQQSANVCSSTSTSTSSSDAIVSSAQKSSPTESQPKFDLNLLSPNTLKYLSKADVEKYMSSHPAPNPQKPVDVDFGNLSKMVDRLNQAASRSGKRADSAERNFRAVSPPSMPRIKRSSSCDISPYRKMDTQNPCRPLSPVPKPAPRPASVAAMPIRIKVKVKPISGSPVDQPIRISVNPHQAPIPEIVTRDKPDVIVVEDETQNEVNPCSSPVGDVNMDETDEPLLMSPEQEIAQQVLESVPPEILEGSNGQTVVIMTDSGDMSEEEVMMLARAALEQNEGDIVEEDGKNCGDNVVEEDGKNSSDNVVEEDDRNPGDIVDLTGQGSEKEAENSGRASVEVNAPEDTSKEVENVVDMEQIVTGDIESGSENASIPTEKTTVTSAPMELTPHQELETTASSVPTEKDSHKEPETSESSISTEKDPRQDPETSTSSIPTEAALNQTPTSGICQSPTGSPPRIGQKEKKTLSPTSGTIDRKVLEKNEDRIPIYKSGMLIGWKINLDDLAENTDKKDKSVSEDQEVKKEVVDETSGREKLKMMSEMKTETSTELNSKRVKVTKCRESSDSSIVIPEGPKLNDSEETLSATSDGDRKISTDEMPSAQSQETLQGGSSEDVEVKMEMDDLKTENDDVEKEITDGKDDGREMEESDTMKDDEADKEKELEDDALEEDDAENPGKISKKGCTPLKTYPLRRTSQRLSDHGADVGKPGQSSDSMERKSQELPLHDKIAQKIKAESLAKSSPGVKGPFKCLTCKRLYRTKESFNTHVQNCDFEVSTSEEEEDEEPRLRYPVRSRHKSLENQGCVVKLTDIRKDSQFEKYNRNEKDTTESVPVKRGRGRPPKKKKVMEPEVVDVCVSDEELDKSPDPKQPKSHKRMLSRLGVSPSDDDSPRSTDRQSRQSKRMLSPNSSSDSKGIVSPESREPPAKRGRGRPSSKEYFFVPKDKDETEKESASPETSPVVAVKRSRGRPKKQDLSQEATMEESDADSKKTPKKSIENVKDINLSPEFRLCEVTGMMKNKLGKVKEMEVKEDGDKGTDEASQGKEDLVDSSSKGKGTDSAKGGSESQMKSGKPRKTVFNHTSEDTISPLDVITDLTSDEPTKLPFSPKGQGRKTEDSASAVKSDGLKMDPSKTSKVGSTIVNSTSRVASILQSKTVPKTEMENLEKGRAQTSETDGLKKLEKVPDYVPKKMETIPNLPAGETVEMNLMSRNKPNESSSVEDQCSHFIDKEKSTQKVQYYVVYPPNARNAPDGSKISVSPGTVCEDPKPDKTCVEPKKIHDSMKSKPHPVNAKNLKNPVKATKPILPGNLQVGASNTISSFINSNLNQSAPAFPQPLVIPQTRVTSTVDIRQPSTQPRNIFDALQPQSGVSIIGSPPLQGVHSSNVLESAVAHLNQTGVLSSIQTTLHQIQPQIPQPLTINTSLPLPQGPSIIPNIPRIIQQPTSTVLTASINQIPQTQFHPSTILRTSIPVSQSTIIHQSPALLQSNLLPQPQTSPVAQPNVLVPPSQQVLPTNLISPLGNLLPGQLTPQQATVVSRLNLQHQQRGMEYMGSFLLDSKPQQPFVSVAQTSPVLTQSLTPQQTQQIMNLVSGSVMNKDLSSLGTVFSQNLVSTPTVQVQTMNPQISSALQTGLGVRTVTPVNVVKTRTDTILHSNLVRHLPDGCKTVVCSPSDAVTMLKRILPVSKERSESYTTVTLSSSQSTVSPSKTSVSSPNLRNILNDGPLANPYPSTSVHESTVRPHQIVHRPGAPLNKGFSVLKKILKPAILHRKRSSITVTALKRHLAMSPEKNGIIQGQISENICNSLENHMQEREESTPSPSTSHIDSGHTYTKPLSHSEDTSPSVSTCTSDAGTNSPAELVSTKQPRVPGKRKVGKVTKLYKKVVSSEMQQKSKGGGARKRKSPPRLRNIHEKYKGPGAISHPLIHHQKEVMSLPQPELEEEVRETPMMPYFDINNQKRRGEGKLKDEPRLMFEIMSDDGFHCTGETMEDVWRQVTERVQDARSAARMKALSYVGMNSANMFGLNNNTVVYLMEQLFGARHCHKYSFSYFQHEIEKQEEEPTENPSGCIRCEPFTSRKPYDMFSFLMSRYRSKPKTDLGLKNVEMIHKSQRRATSMDLPMAMRFRKLQEHAKEAVGVYRSHIHGRGLFCKRNIDSGEMVIEYAGEVIRASLTDKREKYYESKGIGCYMFRIDDFEVVDATMHGSAARFINHSCEPNCYSRVINVDGKKHIVIFAMRPISKGEELTYDYKFPIEEVKIPCSCGSKKCRKYLN